MDLTTNKYRIEVGVRELKNQLSRYIDQVREGKEVIVTEHGKPVARLTMLTEQDDRLWMNWCRAPSHRQSIRPAIAHVRASERNCRSAIWLMSSVIDDHVR